LSATTKWVAESSAGALLWQRCKGQVTLNNLLESGLLYDPILAQCLEAEGISDAAGQFVEPDQAFLLDQLRVDNIELTEDLEPEESESMRM
jgi:hypothetical protein